MSAQFNNFQLQNKSLILN